MASKPVMTQLSLLSRSRLLRQLRPSPPAFCTKGLCTVAALHNAGVAHSDHRLGTPRERHPFGPRHRGCCLLPELREQLRELLGRTYPSSCRGELLAPSQRVHAFPLAAAVRHRCHDAVCARGRVSAGRRVAPRPPDGWPGGSHFVTGVGGGTRVTALSRCHGADCLCDRPNARDRGLFDAALSAGETRKSKPYWPDCSIKAKSSLPKQGDFCSFTQRKIALFCLGMKLH